MNYYSSHYGNFILEALIGMNEVIINTEPRWMKKAAIQARYALGFRRLNSYVSSGYIRTVKFVEGKKQACRIYYAPDLDDLLLKLSAGHKPLPKIGRIKP